MIKAEIRKVGLNLPVELIEKIEEKADKMYITKTAYITMAIVEKLQKEEMLEAANRLNQTGNDLMKAMQLMPPTPIVEPKKVDIKPTKTAKKVNKGLGIAQLRQSET